MIASLRLAPRRDVAALDGGACRRQEPQHPVV